jgi:hypothetical protein
MKSEHEEGPSIISESARILKEHAMLMKEQIDQVIEEIKEEKKHDTRENSMGDLTPPI